MELVEDATLLRIYLGESDRVDGEPAYKAIVHRLQKEGLWGATVLRGIYGFGKKNAVHAASPLRLSTDLPIVVEAVDGRDKVERVLPVIAPMVRGGLVVTVPVKAHVVMEGGPAPPGAGEVDEGEEE